MKAVSDNRYNTIKVLIDSGHITSFPDIFNFIPKTVVYKDLQVNFNRFSKAVHNPAKLTMDELLKLAEMFKVDPRLIVDMAFKQILAVRHKGRKKRDEMISK